MYRRERLIASAALVLRGDQCGIYECRSLLLTLLTKLDHHLLTSVLILPGPKDREPEPTHGEAQVIKRKFKNCDAEIKTIRSQRPSTDFSPAVTITVKGAHMMLLLTDQHFATRRQAEQFGITLARKWCKENPFPRPGEVATTQNGSRIKKTA